MSKKAKQTKKQLHHYLVTLDLFNGMRMHAYMILDDERKYDDRLNRLANAMLDLAEKQNMRPFMDIFLSTKLDAGVTVVREILSVAYPEAKQQWDTVKDFHLTVWGMPAGIEEDKRLMDLH